jgi:hypothetical protein
MFQRLIALLLTVIITLTLVACGDDNPEGFQEPTTTTEPGASSVDILLPQTSTIVYAESIQISGRLADSPQQFSIRLITPDGQTIAEAQVDAQPGNWQLEVVHGYSGDPSEIEIQAVAANGEIYDRESILLSSITHRPEGAFVSIIVPLDGDTVGGDLILVEGRASGIESDSMTIELIDSNNSIVDSQVVTLNNPAVIDEVPWSAELNRGQTTGSALLRISGIQDGAITEFDQIAVVLSEAAG